MGKESPAAWYLQAAQDALQEASRTPRRYASGPRTRPERVLGGYDDQLPSTRVLISQV